MLQRETKPELLGPAFLPTPYALQFMVQDFVQLLR